MRRPPHLTRLPPLPEGARNPNIIPSAVIQLTRRVFDSTKQKLSNTVPKRTKCLKSKLLYVLSLTYLFISNCRTILQLFFHVMCNNYVPFWYGNHVLTAITARAWVLHFSPTMFHINMCEGYMSRIHIILLL